jgi:hypothetical protein
MATIEVGDAQRVKFEKFLSDPRSPQVTKLLKVAVAAAELNKEDLGIYWGVTVCPDKDAFARINVSNRILFSIDMDCQVIVLVLEHELGMGRLPKKMRWSSGFPTVEDSQAVVFENLSEAEKAFGMKAFNKAFIAHSKTQWRKLPNSKWHNPLTNSFLF